MIQANPIWREVFLNVSMLVARRVHQPLGEQLESQVLDSTRSRVLQQATWRMPPVFGIHRQVLRLVDFQAREDSDNGSG